MKKAFRPDVDAPEWKGGHAPYDIIKEGTIAVAVVLILTIVLAVLFGSPDDPSVTIKTWSNATPVDFAQTALSELNGTSGTAQYGAPYNTASEGQKLGPLALAKWAGARHPVNTVRDFVIDPLRALPNQPTLDQGLQQWSSASSSTRSGWVTNYTNAAAKMTYANDQVVVPATNAGPVPVFISDLTQMARTGALDQSLVTQNGFYTTDFTKPLLFLSDGSYLANKASKDHLLGEQWGMMNETGSYPGQAWLWLYSGWYQIAPFNSSANADVQIWALMMLLSVILLFLPFIPGLRAIPRKVKVYRIIWREHYRDL
ncbi:MAG TPA: hypothetical protein VMU98_00235 [Acidimicrobiales bacterium]|nr:hypothetical protein [Acidimicrobiales bacterium]